MAGRDRSLGALAIATGLALSAATLAAQGSAVRAASSKPWVVERTPDGHPDFQGVWANNTVTPLQRPKQWEGKTRLTDQEVKELQRIAQQIYDNDGDAQFGDGLILAVLDRITNPGSYDPGTGNYNQFWLAGRDWHDRRTALITSPADGKIPPLTAAAQQRRADEMESRRLHAFEDPEVFPAGERCVNFGWPKVGAGYNSYLQIVQTPGYVTMMAEMAHDARIIPTDGRPHADQSVRGWNGDPRGRWEGDTLVVDTTNFTDKTNFRGAPRNTRQDVFTSESLHVVERFTLAGPDQIHYQFEVEDPATWTRSWSGEVPIRRFDGPLYEYACHEGNYSLRHILMNARAQERDRR